MRVTNVTHDSRQAGPGTLFVAVPGQVNDGADFAGAAVAAGAVAVVAASEDPGLGVPWIVARDVRSALAALAAEAVGHPSERLVVAGITGTNGKTTTTDMTAAILAASGRATGSLGTLKAAWPGMELPAARTTPEAPDLQRLLARMEADGCTHAVMEVSSHAIDLQRVLALRFSVVAFTNLTQDHLDWHRTMQAYAASKERLFADLAPRAAAAICIDGEPGRQLAGRLRQRRAGRVVVTCGFASDADLRIVSFEPTPAGSRVRLSGRVDGADLDARFLLPMLGRHAAQNAALATAVALLAGGVPEAVAPALARFAGVPGRLEAVLPEAGADDGVRVYVDYAHTPDALEAALSAVREGLDAGRVLCVFGCGGDRDPGKRAPMGAVVGRLADVAIVTSDNPRGEDPRAILDQVLVGLRGASAEVLAEVDRRQAIRRALELAQPGDVVVVAGKGHETTQDIGGTRMPFDDRVVVRELRRARRSQ